MQVMVIGARSGIGAAITQVLLAQGHSVIGTSRDPDLLTFDSPDFSPERLDLMESASLDGWVKSILARYPLLDAVVFSAGMGFFGYLEQLSIAQMEEVMRVNFLSQMVITRRLIPFLKQRPKAHLVYIGSEAALKGARQGSLYCASKFALRGFTQSLRDECGKSSVRVSLINPGMVMTPFFDLLDFVPGSEPGQFLEAADVGRAVSYILSAPSHCMIDEINLSPATRVINFKK